MDCLKVLASHLISRPVSWVTLTSCDVIAFTQQKTNQKNEHKPLFFIVPGDEVLCESFALSTTACG